MLIVALAAGLLTQVFPCCAFAIRSFSKVSATPDQCSRRVIVFFSLSETDELRMSTRWESEMGDGSHVITERFPPVKQCIANTRFSRLGSNDNPN